MWGGPTTPFRKNFLPPSRLTIPPTPTTRTIPTIPTIPPSDHSDHSAHSDHSDHSDHSAVTLAGTPGSVLHVYIDRRSRQRPLESGKENALLNRCNLRIFFLVFLAVTIACDHPSPTNPITSLPPAEGRTGSAPFRMSFNTGHDGEPVFHGDYIVYSRLDETNNRDNDWCIAFLHRDSITLSPLTACPQGGGGNGIREAWIDPVFSPDGSQIAFFRTIGTAGAQRVAFDFDLMVGPALDPTAAERLLTFDGGIFEVNEPRTVRATRGRDLHWWDNETLIVLGGQVNFASGDTAFTSLGIASISVADADVTLLPVSPSVRLAMGQSGQAFAVDPPVDTNACTGTCPPRAILRITPTGAVDTITTISNLAVDDLDVSGNDIFLLSNNGVLRIDAATGEQSVFTLDIPENALAQSLAVSPAGFIAAQLLLAPAPSNIWLLRTP